MIINRFPLLQKAPIVDMLNTKKRAHGVSYGLTEAGYDLRIKQSIEFRNICYPACTKMCVFVDGNQVDEGRFVIASAIEEFDMPEDLVGVVHDKSTWARAGLSVFNTVIEPGWKGFLTLELVYHGNRNLFIPAGAGIAQVLFSHVSQPAAYAGKYQNQADMPVSAVFKD